MYGYLPSIKKQKASPINDRLLTPYVSFFGTLSICRGTYLRIRKVGWCVEGVRWKGGWGGVCGEIIK